MSETKHTPGPWHARRGGWGRYSIDSQLPVHVGKRNSYSVCQIALNYGAVTEANARLIAAAPDYHAEALALVARHDKCAQDANFDRCGCDDCKPFRAVIAKAEGHRHV